MAALNRGAAEAMMELGIRAATDVTGFGLLGHLRQMLRNSRSLREDRQPGSSPSARCVRPGSRPNGSPVGPTETWRM